MAATMRAAVCYGARDIRIEEVPRPRPEPGEVLVRVHANGICGTDASEYVSPQMYPLHARHGLTGHEGPLIPGHEFAGTIAEIGDDVEGFREGEAIVTGAALWCGACPQCLAGRLYATVGLHRDGGLAEYVRVPAHIVFRAEPFGLDGDLAVLTQPMAIAVHALRRGAPRAEELDGRDVVVIGVGGIGAFLTYALARSGARVIAVDVAASRLALARDLGAADAVLTGATGEHHAFLSPGEAAGESVTLARALARRDIAASLVFEVTGTDAGFTAAIAAVEPGGRLVTVGIAKHPIAIDARRVTTKELELIGTNALIGREDVPEAARLLASEPALWQHVAPSAIPLDRLVEDGIAPMLEGRAGQIKMLVDPWTATARRAVVA
jgi:(R,R)-butanediol dehydrogenase / meso-butanediol dehydrogenase / diacetyl reductase